MMHELENLINTNVVSVSPEQKISEVISLFIEKRIHQVPVVDKKKLIGLVWYNDLLQKSVNVHTKISSIVRPSIKLNKNTELSKVLELLLLTEYRAIPIVEKEKMIGIISENDLLKLVETNEKISSVKTIPLVKISKKCELSDLRAVLLNVKTTRLLVYEKDKMLGIVSGLDLLHVIIPKEKMTIGERAGEKIKAEFSLDQFIKKDITIDKNDTIKNAIELMNKNNVSSLVVTMDGKPESVITAKTILSFLFPKKASYNIEVSGLGKEEAYKKSALDNIISRVVDKISVMTSINSVNFHITKSHEVGESAMYTIKGKFDTKAGMFFAHESEWDLLEAFNSILNKLEKQCIKKIKRIQTRRKTY